MSSLSAKILDRLSIGGVNECWEWKAGRSEGYGRVRHPVTGKALYVHRAAYEEWRGPIPEGLTIDHLCRNRACANPRHLEPVPLKENILRGGNSLKTHCKWGHEFTPENTLIYEGARYCRICMRRRRRASESRR